MSGAGPLLVVATGRETGRATGAGAGPGGAAGRAAGRATGAGAGRFGAFSAMASDVSSGAQALSSSRMLVGFW